MLARALLVVALVPSLAAQPSPSAPPKRAHHALVYDEATARVLLAGGSSPFENGQCCDLFNDLWAYDGAGWTRLPESGDKISSLRLVFDSRSRRILSFGGYPGPQRGILRVLENDQWKSLGTLVELPVSEPGFAYDIERSRFVAFGGSSGPGRDHEETWEWDSRAWTRFTGRGPSARQAHTMVYDERRARTVVFGGMHFTAPGQPPERLADVWEFDGASWTEQQTSNGPSAREGAGAAYDSKRGVVLVFGGSDGTGFQNDLWAWNGRVWTQLDPGGTGRPDPRAMGYIAYDRKRDRIVLFGGRNGWPNGDFNDTWEWDGRIWKRIGT